MFLDAKEEDCEYIVMEVSSHALDKNRIYGLEFDAVIVSNASSELYGELERNLFYVVLTRALHKLEIFYTGNYTKLILGDGDEQKK